MVLLRDIDDSHERADQLSGTVRGPLPHVSNNFACSIRHFAEPRTRSGGRGLELRRLGLISGVALIDNDLCPSDNGVRAYARVEHENAKIRTVREAVEFIERHVQARPSA